MYPDDLAALDRLDKERVLLTLGNRYSRGQFQTYVGDVLLIINPQQETNLYDNEVNFCFLLSKIQKRESIFFAIIFSMLFNRKMYYLLFNISITNDTF